MVFTPFKVNQATKDTVAINNSVYPAVQERGPVLEVRLEFRAREEGETVQKIGPSTLRSVQITFWNFDEPTPVVRVESESWEASSAEMSVVGLDGTLKHEGWIVGTLRGRKAVHSSKGRDDSYIWNIDFATNLT